MIRRLLALAVVIFSGVGMALGVVGFFGGMMFLAPYLLWASVQSAGDVRVLLLGKDRVGR